MARTPDWSKIVPSYTIQSYWTSTWTWQNPNAGYWTNQKTIVNPNNIESRGERSYAVTPGFHNPNRMPPLAPLGFTAEFSDKSAYGFSRSIDRQLVNDPQTGASYMILTGDSSVTSSNVFQVGFLPNPITSSVISDLDRKARAKVLADIKGMSINVAQATAERKQTMNTVTSAVKAIAKSIHALKRGDFTKAASAFGIKPPKRGRRRFGKEFADDASHAVGNGWLALQYGWRPLVNDVYGAAKELAEASVGTNAVFFISSGLGRRAFDERKVTNTPPPSGYSGSQAVFQQYQGSISVRYKVRYSKSSPQVAKFSSLGITNPALIAWELMPYSFVIDWFVPVGNFLSSLDATLGLEFKSGFSVRLEKGEFHSIRDVHLGRANPPSSISGGNREFEKYAKMRRTILSGFPEAPLPSFKNPVSFSHMASAFALLNQLRR